MNIFSTPHIHAKAKAPNNNVLDLLGKQLTVDPEMLKLLEEGSAQNGNVDFSALLENMSKHNPNMSTEITPKNLEVLAKDLNVDIKAVEEVLAQNPKIKNLLLKAQTLPDNEVAQTLAQVGNEVKESNSKQTEPLQEKKNFFVNNQKITKNELSQNLSHEVKSEPKILANQLKNTQTNKEVEFNEIQKSKTVDFNKLSEHKNMSKNMSKNAMPYSADKSILKAQNIAESNISEPVNKVVKSQDFILNQLSGEAGQQSGGFEQSFGQSQQSLAAKMTQLNSAPTPTAVFDVNSMTGNESTEQLITKIQDYVTQAKVSNQQEVKFSFRHHDLGQVDLHVQKAQNNALNISIGTATADAAKFFSQNQGELLTVLNQSGVQVSDFKLETSQSQNQSQKEFAGNNQQNNGQNPGSQSGERHQEQKKREELWNQVLNKEVA